MHPIDRRHFLRLGCLAMIGAAAACGKGSDPVPKASGHSLDAIIAGRRQSLHVLIPPIPPRPNERVPVILQPAGESDRFVREGTARMWAAKDRTSTALGPFPLAFHSEGLEHEQEGPRGIWSTRVPQLDQGSWLALVELTSGAAPVLGGGNFTVIRSSGQPIAGEKAISAPTPTPRDHRGVEPYCTRKPEPCGMHAVSLDRALANGKPTILIIATPAFCESRICGPVVDVVESVAGEMRGDANFVHIEVYKDDRDAPAKRILAPAAKAWKLEEEPALYFIESTGNIKDRFIGLAGADEIRDVAKTLS